MKRSSKIKSSAYATVSTNLISQNLVYMHMSSHYRRLMNAKSQVDSSLPTPRRSQILPHALPMKQTIDNYDIDLVNQIAFDSINGPDAYCSNKLSPPRIRPHSLNKKRPSRPPNKMLAAKTVSRPPADLIEQHPESFEHHGCEFIPRVLKSNAESRVRELNVYHPPRRRKRTPAKEDCAEPKTPFREIECEVGEKTSAKFEDHWLLEQTASTEPSNAVCNQCGHGNPQHSSKVSIGSRDSAYNGGISSGADSRGPTPEQTVLVKPSVQHFTSTSANKFGANINNKQKDDALYATFTHLITEDILRREIFSDRGMNAVFERHIEDNRLILDMGRMKDEISNLRVQLGMPEGDFCSSQNKFSTDSRMWDSGVSNTIESNADNLCRPSATCLYKIVTEEATEKYCSIIYDSSVNHSDSAFSVQVDSNIDLCRELDNDVERTLAEKTSCKKTENTPHALNNISREVESEAEATVIEEDPKPKEMCALCPDVTLDESVNFSTELSESEQEQNVSPTTLHRSIPSTSNDQGDTLQWKPIAMPRTLNREKTSLTANIGPSYQLQAHSVLSESASFDVNKHKKSSQKENEERRESYSKSDTTFGTDLNGQLHQLVRAEVSCTRPQIVVNKQLMEKVSPSMIDQVSPSKAPLSPDGTKTDAVNNNHPRVRKYGFSTNYQQGDAFSKENYSTSAPRINFYPSSSS